MRRSSAGLPLVRTVSEFKPKKENGEPGFNILSFDGGGSLGLLEAQILQDVMNLATVLRDNPKATLLAFKLA